jgi:hypothetical protein
MTTCNVQQLGPHQPVHGTAVSRSLSQQQYILVHHDQATLGTQYGELVQEAPLPAPKVL